MAFSNIRLSVLDVAPVWTGSTGTDALHRAVDLAHRVEALGYTRYWVAEHHNTPSLATSAPAVLAGRIAATTTTLRVGSGGVLLPHHAPLAVAEQFSTLEALHPGRVDLGIGRAAGSDAKTAEALGGMVARGPMDFPEQLMELSGYFDAPASAASPTRVTATPTPAGRPWMCLLGSSPSSAAMAGMLGLPYAFAHQIVPELTVAAVETYRANFRPSAILDRPYVIVGAMVTVGEDDAHADELIRPYLVRKLLIRGGDFYGLYPSPAEAASYEMSSAERAWVTDHCEHQFFGGPEAVSRKLRELHAACAPDELMGVTIVPGHEDRVRSYERLGELTSALDLERVATG